ncbi:hypothetical protein [Levilactobacillus cerevisiae]|uniref:hypothetical protein n=1 Tax=Levilactobacillus cerevisiae TaxID=1704076 RepID=UPI0013DE79C9|nr:hypothetical protein [Levilactobacillus cerevisiae]
MLLKVVGRLVGKVPHDDHKNHGEGGQDRGDDYGEFGVWHVPGVNDKDDAE